MCEILYKLRIFYFKLQYLKHAFEKGFLYTIPLFKGIDDSCNMQLATSSSKTHEKDRCRSVFRVAKYRVTSLGFVIAQHATNIYVHMCCYSIAFALQISKYKNAFYFKHIH